MTDIVKKTLPILTEIYVILPNFIRKSDIEIGFCAQKEHYKTRTFTLRFAARGRGLRAGVFSRKDSEKNKKSAKCS